MRRFALILVLAWSGSSHAADICGPAIAAAELTLRTAPGLLGAIGVVESGRADPRTRIRHPWPWTVTAGGIGTYYASKMEAIRAVEGFRAKGVLSVDVGCMQVNLMYHPAAFRDLEQAFDPSANAVYAARFLTGLFQRLGTWPAAAAGYHSLSPDRGAQYAKLISAVWGGAPVPTVAGPGGVEIVVFPDGGQMRVLRVAASGSLGQPSRIVGYLSGP